MGEENQVLQETIERKEEEMGDFDLKNKELASKLEDVENEKELDMARMSCFETTIAELKLQMQSKDDDLSLKVQNIADLSDECEEKVAELLELKNEVDKIKSTSVDSGGIVRHVNFFYSIK